MVSIASESTKIESDDIVSTKMSSAFVVSAANTSFSIESFSDSWLKTKNGNRKSKYVIIVLYKLFSELGTVNKPDKNKNKGYSITLINAK